MTQQCFQEIEKIEETNHKCDWIQGLPTEPGWYWFFNGAVRFVAVIKENRLFRNEDDPRCCGYPLEYYSDAKEVWHMPCVPPSPPQL